MTDSTITDPAVVGYAFFFRWLEDESEQKRASRESDFARVLQETWARLLSWLDRETTPVVLAEQARLLGKDPNRPAMPPDRHLSYLVATSHDLGSPDGWLRSANQERAVFLEARTYGDVFTLEVGRALIGQHPPEALAQLQGEDWLPPHRPGFLGAGYCLAGKTADGVNLGPRVLRAWGVEYVTAGSFQSGWIGRPVEDLSPLLLLYATDEEEAAVGALWHGPILGLMLQWCKARRIIREHEEVYRQAEAKKREIVESIRLAKPPVNDLRKLEHDLDTLTEHYAQLSGSHINIQRQLGTLSVSLRNMEIHIAELQQAGLSSAERFFNPIVQEYRRGEEQIRVDLEYLVATLEEAQTILRAVDTGVDIERGKIEQMANTILGVIAVLLAVGQAVDSEMACTFLRTLGYAAPSDVAITLLRLAAMVIFAALTLVLLLLLVRGKRRPCPKTRATAKSGIVGLAHHLRRMFRRS